MGSTPSGIAVIGIVGGIGAGKSTVAGEMARAGCEVIDADAIGHDLLSVPEVSAELRRRWGEGIFLPDGTVDRPALGEIVFNDPDQLCALHAILHPRIRRGIEERIAAIGRSGAARAIVLDAAVLFEAKWDDLCTRVVFVDASEARRRRRVTAQRGWDPEIWAAREKSQIPLDKKRQLCDYTLDNGSSVSCLRERVRELLRKIALDHSS